MDASSGTPEPRSGPEVIERRLSGARTWYALALPAVAGGLFAWYGLHRPVALTGAVVLWAITILLALGFVRSRTVIGPDGVRDRAIGREVFVPWSEVVDVTGLESLPRVVRLVRADGSVRTLSAVRDERVDGLGLDDVVRTVRERAAGPSERPADAPGRPAGPVRWRPSRRPLVWLLPLAAGLPFAGLLLGGPVEIALTAYGTVIAYFLFVLALKLLRGRTEADADGLRDRLIFRTRSVRWTDVTGFAVDPTLFGRVAKVNRRNGKPLTLAAPRDGLLGRDPGFDTRLETLRTLAEPHHRTPPLISRLLSARVTRSVYAVAIIGFTVLQIGLAEPWLEPWWPGRHEAATVPRACSVADPAAKRLLADGRRRDDRHRNYTYFLVSECGWYDSRNGASLAVEYELQRRVSDSGTDEGREEYASSLKALRTGHEDAVETPLRGLGDEAARFVDTRDGGEVSVRVIARRANVVVEIQYSAARPAREVVPAAEALARAAVGALRLD